jgi:hypothetical protein
MGGAPGPRAGDALGGKGVKDLTGKWCIIIGHTGIVERNNGMVVQAIRVETPSFMHPGASLPFQHGPCWLVSKHVLWGELGKNGSIKLMGEFPYVQEKFLQPLPDLDEPVENTTQKPLDTPVVFG